MGTGWFGNNLEVWGRSARMMSVTLPALLLQATVSGAFPASGNFAAFHAGKGRALAPFG